MGAERERHESTRARGTGSAERSSPRRVQHLTVGATTDPAEREAERIAGEVIASISSRGMTTDVATRSHHEASRVRRSAVGAPVDDLTVRRLPSTKQFKKKSGGALSGKRNRVLQVDKALSDVAGASSKSMALDNLIQTCRTYLAAPGIDSTRKKAVKRLLAEAIADLSQWRIRARIPLPEFVFRMDERAPDVIAKVGFQPWKPTGSISIIEHVNGVIDSSRPEAGGKEGQLAKPHSQFVSTAADLEFAKDPTLVQGLLAKRFYKISTRSNSDTYTDVGEHFDEQGVPNPYEKQLEFIQRGGIPPENVVAFCKGEDVMSFVLGEAPVSSITWTAMPSQKKI